METPGTVQQCIGLNSACAAGSGSSLRPGLWSKLVSFALAFRTGFGVSQCSKGTSHHINTKSDASGWWDLFELNFAFTS